MSDYIKREDAVKILRGDCVARFPTTFANGLFAASDALEHIPAAPVREVVRGRWEWDSDSETGHNIRRCSCCSSGSGWAFNFCPNCGADMRGEEGAT